MLSPDTWTGIMPRPQVHRKWLRCHGEKSLSCCDLCRATALSVPPAAAVMSLWVPDSAQVPLECSVARPSWIVFLGWLQTVFTLGYGRTVREGSGGGASRTGETLPPGCHWGPWNVPPGRFLRPQTASLRTVPLGKRGLSELPVSAALLSWEILFPFDF